ncbi:hypothetical protein ERJ75_001205700 [Trypanosoma vivax]|nr:hypothetical protein ERJ75_001205700 [Trypanosoma vivax]
MWRDAAAALWESVTDVRSPQHLDCNNFGDAECKAVLSQVNELMEVGRQARTAAEVRLSDAISVLVTVEQQINKGKALLESVLGVDNGALRGMMLMRRSMDWKRLSSVERRRTMALSMVVAVRIK